MCDDFFVNFFRKKMQIGVLGPAGTFSDLAFSAFFRGKKAEKIFFENFSEMFSALFSKKLDAIFVPVKTKIRAVAEIQKLQKKYHFSAENYFDFPVEYFLVGRKNDEIFKIFGRDESFLVAENFLKKHFSRAEKIAVESSATAVEKLKTGKNAAAICAEKSAGNFEILKKVGDGMTTFALLKAQN